MAEDSAGRSYQLGKGREYKPDPNKFDLITHHWDGQGHLIRKNLYTCYRIDGNVYYERPVNSGNLWYENNQPAGRVLKKLNEKGQEISKTFDFAAPHIDYTVPLEGDDALKYQLEQERARSTELENELKAIRGEAKEKPEKASAQQTKVNPRAAGLAEALGEVPPKRG